MSMTKTAVDPDLFGGDDIPEPPTPPAKFKTLVNMKVGGDETLTAPEAEALVFAIKGESELYRKTAAEIRRMVTILYKGEGWKALGYKSWRQCVISEFDESSQAELYRALTAGKVEAELIEGGLDPNTVLPEGHLLALGKLPEGEKLPTYEEALQAVENGQTLTTEQVQQIVANKLGIDTGDGSQVFQAPADGESAPEGQPELKASKKAARLKTCQMLRELIIAIVHERKTATREELAQSAVDLLAMLEDL